MTGVNHVTLAVLDLDRSVIFYTDLLGARLRARWPDGAYLTLGDLWLCLELTVHMSPREDDSHLALSAAPGSFDPLARRIRSETRIWKENRSEGASVYFLDPDGHRLELHNGTLASRLAHYRCHPVDGMEIFGDTGTERS
ncbi:VOC family protein [Palleronia caenipelagi]|uniref:VOC family protein n=1 Tax=Palleronia caenipelagi TaxID=2489174 RepID=UPI001C8F61C7|nr:VOC family protein [Palleronia caenipelagi]